MTYDQLLSKTQAYRKTVGLPAKEVDPALKAAGEAVVKANDDLEMLKKSLADFEATIIPGADMSEETTAELNKRKAEVGQAENQLAYARTNYETELARWQNTQAT